MLNSAAFFFLNNQLNSDTCVRLHRMHDILLTAENKGFNMWVLYYYIIVAKPPVLAVRHQDIALTLIVH